MSYVEDLIEEFGVTHIWKEAIIRDSIVTRRGTTVEMVERPKWGLACYMDNSIQSALIDEKIYHEALVHPIMLSVKNRHRVMIVGGGEGATAREVLKWSGVEKVDMYEWDQDVIQLFKEKYPEWAKGAWNDSRLEVHTVDIFEVIKTPPEEHYDVIIIDLFEPCEENRIEWYTLIKTLHNWVSLQGSIVMYAGMRNILEKEQPYNKLIDMIEYTECYLTDKKIIPYHVYIPSFSGESMFLLLKDKTTTINFNSKEATRHKSHISEAIWNSYKTLNW